MNLFGRIIEQYIFIVLNCHFVQIKTSTFPLSLPRRRCYFFLIFTELWAFLVVFFINSSTLFFFSGSCRVDHSFGYEVKRIFPVKSNYVQFNNCLIATSFSSSSFTNPVPILLFICLLCYLSHIMSQIVYKNYVEWLPELAISERLSRRMKFSSVMFLFANRDFWIYLFLKIQSFRLFKTSINISLPLHSLTLRLLRRSKDFCRCLDVLLVSLTILSFENCIARYFLINFQWHYVRHKMRECRFCYWFRWSRNQFL